MKGYHGTSYKYAISMCGPPPNILVDFNVGNKELGKGFYLGESISLASSWAQGRFKSDPAVIKIKISDSIYSRLKIGIISTNNDVTLIWNKKKTLEKFNCLDKDVVVGPFAKKNFGRQFKFQSKVAEKLLNSDKIKRKIL